jgi:cell surface protein SprA
MFIHAEESYTNKPVDDKDLHFFIRLGTDFTQNYYEYDIPLYLTPWGSSDAHDIWPEQNEIALEIAKLLSAKQARNIIMREDPNGNVNLMTPFIQMDGQNRITVVGTPTLSSVKTIMVGIRNPKSIPGSTQDDGLDKCAEIWVNELRMTDFDEQGGWAANTIISADLADLGNVVLAGNISTAGFGSLEQKVNERQQENIYGYDFATNLELGKFFPETSGIRIPMHYDISESFKDPEFNPLNPDIKYQDDLSTFKDKKQRDSIREISTDYTKRTSFNLMNMKKMRTGTSKKPHIYDIENFDFTYQYSQQYHSNIDIQYDDKKTYKGAIGYSYTKNPKNYKPFSKNKFLRKHRSLALIRDFNFNLLPKQLGFRTDVSRLYNENLLRKKTRSLIIINPTYVKSFNWNRNYDLRYDFSRSLKLDYKAIVQARIDEPSGLVDRNSPYWHETRDSIMNSITDLGRVTNFKQIYNINYAVPINKIPILNWINMTTKYGGDYRWITAPLSTPFLGNTIENSNKIQVNTSGNMVSLYNKIKYLKKINQKGRGRGSNRGRGTKLNMIDDSVADSLKTKKNWGKIVFDATLRVMMMVRNISFSYIESNGTMLPGFNKSPRFLGMDIDNSAPGWDFVFGSQVNIAERAAKNNWISKSQQLNNPTIRKHTDVINARISVEPIPSMKIEITFSRNYSSIRQEYWRYDTLTDIYQSYTPTQTGMFSITYNTWRTSFTKDDDKTHINENFENFKKFLLPIAERLASENPYWDGTYKQDTLNGVLYPDGYNRTNKEVMMYSFMAAYSGEDVESVPLTPFPKFPKPNWRFTYSGLTKIDIIDQWFKTLTISHAYKSMYTVGNYTSNILWKEGQDGFSWVRDQLGDNYIPRYDMSMVSVNEQFSPLVNVDMTLENSLILKVAIKKTRNIAMSFANNQITEIKSNELIIGTGYRFKQVPLSLKLGGGTKTFKSDIQLRFDFSIRENKTVLRKLIENIDQISQGQSIMSINFSADYQFSKNLTFRMFYDQVINNPFVSSQFPTSNIKAGINLRFTLAQ